MSTALATQNTALKHLDVAEGERMYVLAIMAEQLGIPAEDSQDVKVQALIAKAVERNRDFGWKPGVHMHVQSFMANVKDAQNRNTGEKKRQYTLVDGEKAWKDSVMQWRIQHGVKLSYQRKPMTRDELELEVKSMGFTQAIPLNAAGMWCRMIEKDDDRSDPDFPMWSTGLWFGKIKTGSYWNDDHLPTGVTPRDVAVRRADKRSMMQSSFGLLQLDRRSPDERSADLSAELQREVAYKNPTPPDTAQSQRYQVEDDGDILWATDTPGGEVTGTLKLDSDPPAESTETVDGDVVDGPVVDVEFAVDDSDDVEFRDGVPEEVDGSTDTVDGSEDNPFDNENFSPYANLIHNEDYELADTTKSVMDALRNLQETSKRKMSGDGYTKMRDRFVEEEIIFKGTPFTYFIEAATMTHIPGELPGALIGKVLMEMLNDGRQPALKQIGACVETIHMEMTEE